MKGACEGCKFWDSFSWACCNGNSPHRANFVNEGCDFKEEEKMQIKVKLDENAIMPTKAHDTDAGFDLYAPKDYTIKPLTDMGAGSAIIDTGVHMAIPKGYAGELKSKSGLNVKHGIISDGLIDAGYTGSVVVKLYNLSDTEYHIHKGDKITQIKIAPIIDAELVETDTLEETERGNGGFGSSGR